MDRQSITLGDRALGRENNFDIIRFIAAVMVIFAHSYPLGSGVSDILSRSTNGQWDIGAIAVAIFFLISGYLISQSYYYSSGVIAFVKARILRIYPGFIAALLFAIFIVGPLVTTLPINEYFKDPQTRHYFSTIKMFPLQWNLPGVFESNVYKGSVNGSIWTIPFELLCYMFVGIIGVTRILRSRYLVLLVFVLTFFVHLSYSSVFSDQTHIFGLELKTLIGLLTYFTAGMFAFAFRSIIPINKYLAMISFVMLFLSYTYGGLKEYFVIFGSYLILYFAYHPRVRLHSFSKYGDFSYGMYVFAFPIQQVVTHFNGGKMNHLANFGWSVLFSLMISVLSWHLIEKHFLKLKKVRVIPIRFEFPYRKSLAEWTAKYRIFLRKLVGWPAFIVLFLIFVLAVSYYNSTPSSVTFPYHKNTTIFQGGWLPQSSSEKYRWISGTASVKLTTPGDAHKLSIKGFVPDSFTEVKELTIFVNDNIYFDAPVKPSEGIDINLDIQPDQFPKKITLKLVFNAVHVPEAAAPDQRQMSALINFIGFQ